MSTPGYGDDLLDRASAAAFSNCTITVVAVLSAALASATGKGRHCRPGLRARRRAAGRAGKLRRIDHGAGLVGRATRGRDDPKRAAVEHARDIFRRVGRHPYERGDAGGERRDQIWLVVSSETLACSTSI